MAYCQITTMKRSKLKLFRWPLLIVGFFLSLAIWSPFARKRWDIYRDAPTQQMIIDSQHLFGFDSMKKRIFLGDDVNGKLRSRKMSINGNTALHFCATRFDTGTYKEMRLLLDHGADINATNFLRYTPLMEATSQGNVTSVEFLIANGADVNLNTAPWKSGYTPLQIAKFCEKRERANPNEERRVQTKNIVKALEAAGAKQ